MNAMVLKKIGTPLEWTELADPQPGPGEIRVKVAACGVCRTDLHVVDGELPDPKVPMIPGHEIVGRIDLLGAGVEGLKIGERVGIPWLGHTCGVCPYCLEHRENLCDHPLFTGYTRNGGFATMVIADARFAFPLGETGSDVSLAPLLCAGLNRLAFVGDCRRRKKDWPLRLWCRSPYHRAGGKMAGAIRICLYATGRYCHASFCPKPRRESGRAVQTKCRRSRSMRQLFLRPWVILCRWRFKSGSQGRPRRLRGHPHERHSELSVSITLGRATTRVGRQSHAAGWD